VTRPKRKPLNERLDRMIRLGVDTLELLNGVEFTSFTPLEIKEIARRWLLQEARRYEREQTAEAEHRATEVAEKKRQADQAQRDSEHAALKSYLATLTEGDSPLMDPTEFRSYILASPLDPETGQRDTASPRWGIGQRLQEMWKENGPGPEVEACARQIAKIVHTNWDIEFKRRSDRNRQYNDEIQRAVDIFIEETAQEAGIAWTSALLTSTFALPDGTRVKWGEATVDQHQQRASMFSKQATAAVENAARHINAIRDIEKAGAGCLNDLKGKP
jgi:hypothetical protein